MYVQLGSIFKSRLASPTTMREVRSVEMLPITLAITTKFEARDLLQSRDRSPAWTTARAVGRMPMGVPLIEGTC